MEVTAILTESMTLFWRQVHRQTLFLLSQAPLYNKHEALAVEGQSMDESIYTRDGQKSLCPISQAPP